MKGSIQLKRHLSAEQSALKRQLVGEIGRSGYKAVSFKLEGVLAQLPFAEIYDLFTFMEVEFSLLHTGTGSFVQYRLQAQQEAEKKTAHPSLERVYKILEKITKISPTSREKLMKRECELAGYFAFPRECGKALYSEAKKRGCNKIALGHHYDDVIETILMGMLYGAQVQTMMPKLHSTNFEGMELIRPMYLIREDDIKSWRDYNRLHFIQCACHFTDTCSSCREDGTAVSKRMETKLLIRGLKETNPFVEGNIFKSVENVNLKTIIAYKKDGVKHSFLETYDQQENTEK